MAVVQAALLGLTAVLFAAQLKPLRPEYAVYLVLAASIGIGIHADANNVQRFGLGALAEIPVHRRGFAVAHRRNNQRCSRCLQLSQ